MNEARLRPAQVGASTAAAVGGAFLATRLGVYGTIIGVGLITLMSTVGGEMLLRSLERTKQAARSANPRVRGAITADSAHDAPTEIIEPVATTDEFPTVDLTAVADTADTAPLRKAKPSDTQPLAAEQPTAALPAAAPEADDQPSSRRRWPVVAGGFVASFGLALAVIVGIETFTGESLRGDGGPSVVNVFRGAAGEDSDEAPSIPTTPTDEPATPQEPDDGETSSDEAGRTDPQPDAVTPPTENEAPSGGDEPAPQPDEETPAPDDDVTPAPDEETAPPDDGADDEESTTPPPEETAPPENEPTPQP